MERLIFEIEEVTGKRPVLPEYRPVEGSHWSAVVVMCAACKQQRVEVLANMVDVTVAPNLTAPLRGGKINSAFCRQCGQPRCYPIRTWIQEDPGAGDTVGSLSGIFRIEDLQFIYLPPPGTPREARDERLYETRATFLLKKFKWKPQSQASGHGKTAMAGIQIAYSRGDLMRMVEDILRGEDVERIPTDMKSLWYEAARNMRSGLWPIDQARKIIHESVSQSVREEGRSWPLLLNQSIVDMEIFQRLAICWIRENVAEITSQAMSIGVGLKLDTCSALIKANLLGLAETTLHHVEKSIGELAVTDSRRELLLQLAKLCRIELLDAMGEHREASEVEVEMLSSSATSGKTLEDRILRLKTRSAIALKQKHEKKLLESLRELKICVGEWNSLADLVKDPESPSELAFRISILRGASGDLANLANVLDVYRQYVKALRILDQLNKREKPAEEDILWIKQMPEVVAQTPEMLSDEAFDELEAMFPEGISEKRLWNGSLSFLERALQLSTETGQWDFAAIQANNMGLLLFEGKEFDQAESYMQRAVDYAERTGDYTRMLNGYGLLARLATKRGDGEQAIRLVTKGVHTYSRNLVSRGHRARVNTAVQALLSRLSLEAVSNGGPPDQAVLLVENLKELTFVNSMYVDRPDQPGGEDASGASESLEGLRHQLEEVRLSDIYNPDDEQQAGKKDREIERRLHDAATTESMEDPRFSKWVDASDITLTSVDGLRRRLQLLGPATMFLGVFVDQTFYNQPELWTYTLWSEGCNIARREIPAELIRHTDQPAAHLGALEELARVVLDPHKDELAKLSDRDHLIFSLCEGLYSLPLSALPFEGRRLCELVILDFVQSVGILQACIRRPYNRLESILCLGNPARPDLQPLQSSEEEGKSIRETFASHKKDAKLLLRHQATIPALRADAADYDILHIACHAKSTDNRFRMALAPDPHRNDSGELTETRILNEIKTRPGALVNLAACSTGIQGDSGGSVIGGLVPVWMLAGASGVLATLWPIRDDLAKIFQEHFYHQLLGNRGPAESLALTQRDCILSRLGEKMAAPEAWAAFQFYGACLPAEHEGFL
jgi:CHAT domain-containing protein